MAKKNVSLAASGGSGLELKWVDEGSGLSAVELRGGVSALGRADFGLQDRQISSKQLEFRVAGNEVPSFPEEFLDFRYYIKKGWCETSWEKSVLLPAQGHRLLLSYSARGIC